MKKLVPVLLATVLSLATSFLAQSRATEEQSIQTVEFATIRWDGRENSFVVRPNAKVEKLRPLFERFPRPDGIDERIYYMTVAINAVAKEGFEFAGTLNEHVIMKRPVTR